MGADLAFATDGLLISGRVEAKAGPLHSAANPGPDIRRVFPDAAGENHGIGSAHARQECANVFPRTVAEDLDGETDAAVVMLFQFRLQLAHVMGEPRDAQQAGLSVEQRVHFRR